MHHCIPAEQLGKELERQKEGLQQEEAAIQINPGFGGSQFDLLLLSSMQEHQVLDGSLPFSQETGCKARPLSKKRFQGETRSSRPSEAARIEVNLYPKYPTSSGFAGQARWCRSAAFTCGSHPDSSKRWPTTHVTCSSTRYIEIFCVRVIYVMGIICWVVTTDMQILKRDACNLCRIGFILKSLS